MGRKNSNVGRKNDRGRIARRTLADIQPHKQVHGVRIPVEKLVIPSGKCSFQNPRRPKAIFTTKALAEEGLKQAQLKRAKTGSGHVEKRVYQCPDGGCGGWHLSSREAYDEGIRIQRQQQFEAKTKNARLAEIAREKGQQA